MDSGGGVSKRGIIGPEWRDEEKGAIGMRGEELMEKGGKREESEVEKRK